MSSLFSRNRTTSKATPPTSQHLSAAGDFGADDFGRVTSRGKDKDTSKKGKKDKDRARTISDAGSRPVSEATQDIPDGVFLGTSLQPPPIQTPEGAEPYKVSEQPYGHLAAENHVILGLDDACRLVAVVAQELCERGLATPLLFSSSALDINPSMTRRLIAAFIRTCSSPQSQDGKWREEARFAGPHELAMVLRWGLARLVRMDKGQEVHGLLRWELYVSWRTHEHAASYDPNHFITLLPSVQPQIRMILTTLLDLLSRLIAHSTSNGLTPPSLAALFGPLLFGLGALTQGAFQLAYTMYLRSVNATEHIILNYIRYQEAQETVASTLPARLKDWTRNYHGMIPPVDKLDRARIGSRTIRLASIRRNVRLYSPDLVKTAASWATRGDNSLANSKEWSKIVPPSHKLQPKYTDTFRKRMDLPPSFHPDLGPGANLSSSSSTVSTISSIGTLGPGSDTSSVSVVSDDHRFRSLTDMRWGEFESIGFLSGNDKALEFDLTEGARKARDEKRGTMSWSDFSSEGFSRTDEPLSATLQFSAPLATQVNQWPSQNAELQRKLKKAQKSLPAFGWDTEPVLGAEEVIEESFVDCFCDLIYGSGWMDRSEGTFRDCNWALVEFKSLPQQRPTLVPQGDPRTGSTLLLFEEFVPLEYRAQLSAPKKKMRFFLPASSKKQWKPAPTMNGRPYVVGTVNGAPRTPNTEKRNEFEDLLRTSAGVTKVLTIQDAFPAPLAIPRERNLSNLSINRSPDPAVTLPSPLPTPKAERKPLPQSAPATPASPINRTSPSQQPPLPAKTLAPKTSLFNLSKNKRGGMMYDTAIDFEAHTESEGSSDEAPAPPSASKRPGAMAKDPSKRLSRDDAWVDILIGDNRRMDNQAAELRKPGTKAKTTSPDAAREEIARALASVGQRPPDDDDIMPSIKPSFEMRPSTEDGEHNRRDSYPYPAPAIPRHSTDDEDDDDRYGAPEPRDPRINVRPPTVISMPSPESNDFEPLDEPEIPVSPPSSPPSMVLRSPAARPHPAGPRQPSLPAPRAESPQPSRSPSPSGRRPIPPAPEPVAAPKAAPPPKGKGGVSSLIEMYREREKGGSPKKKDEAPAPSRLPVRAPTNPNNVGNGSSASSALSSNGLASNTQTAIPAVVTPPEEKKAPYVAVPVKINALSPSSLAKTTNNTPSKPTPTPAASKTIPPPGPADSGRVSPAPPRYVHGAPLHNVTEEEEED